MPDPYKRLVHLYIISTLVLIGCIALLGFKNRQLSNALAATPYGASADGLLKLIDQKVSLYPEGEEQISNTAAKYVVIVIFTPLDCAGCLPELGELDRIARKRPDLKFYGVMSYASPDEIRQTLRNFKMAIPILQDPDGRIYRSLHLTQTPWKAVINLRERQILMEEAPTTLPIAQQAFSAKLEMLDQEN